MKTIDTDIKNGQFRQCYLLYGEEVYLKKQYKDKLVRATTVEGDTMNFSSYAGKDINPGELVDLAETLPFFADRRVILVEDSGFFKNSCDILAEYLSQINASTCFIFVESEVDKRSKMYKAMKKAGAIIEFATQNEALLTRWILGRIGKENKKITQAVLQLFLSRTGLDMSNIDRELEKLLSYTLKKEVIEASDVEAVVTEQMENRIFDMVDALSGHNQKRALELYYDLLTLKEAPMRILFLITRQFRILAEVKELTGKGYGSFDISKKVGVPEFAVRKYQGQAKNFTKMQLIEALRDGAQVEEDVKTGRLNEKIAVEIFIVKYSKTGN
ncbi:MAG: DNA polymerase III subunit delta [Lachnospiraceae bacterium]|nr:DNA polymerase III subunit delta [Lachnospiraceae bacterium]